MYRRFVGILVILLLSGVAVVPVTGTTTTWSMRETYNEEVSELDLVLLEYLVSAPPVVVIEAPEDGRTFCYPDIFVAAHASDDVGIAWYEIQHEYSTGQTLIHADLIAPQPHVEFEIPLTLLTGWNKITVSAYDTDFQQGTDTITVYYDPTPDIIPPTLVIDYPPDGGIYINPNITARFTAADNCGVMIHTIRHNFSGGGHTTFLTYGLPLPMLTSFEMNFTLEEGLNTITAYAEDRAGHRVATSITLRYIKSKDTMRLESTWSTPQTRATPSNSIWFIKGLFQYIEDDEEYIYLKALVAKLRGFGNGASVYRLFFCPLKLLKPLNGIFTNDYSVMVLGICRDWDYI